MRTFGHRHSEDRYPPRRRENPPRCRGVLPVIRNRVDFAKRKNTAGFDEKETEITLCGNDEDDLVHDLGVLEKVVLDFDFKKFSYHKYI